MGGGGEVAGTDVDTLELVAGAETRTLAASTIPIMVPVWTHHA
jgi:hypothetical protein